MTTKLCYICAQILCYILLKSCLCNVDTRAAMQLYTAGTMMDCGHIFFLSKGIMVRVNREITEMVNSQEVLPFNGIYL